MLRYRCNLFMNLEPELFHRKVKYESNYLLQNLLFKKLLLKDFYNLIVSRLNLMLTLQLILKEIHPNVKYKGHHHFTVSSNFAVNTVFNFYIKYQFRIFIFLSTFSNSIYKIFNDLKSQRNEKGIFCI